MPGRKKVNVAIIESNPLHLEGYLQLLSHQRDIHVTDHDNSARQLFHRIGNTAPDIVLSSINSTDWDITELSAQIRQKHPKCKIVVNGERIPRALLKLLLRQGISSYFLDDRISRQELIRILLDSHTQGHSSSNVLTEDILREIEQLKKGLSENQLSERGLEVLQLASQGLGRKAIACELAISEATVKFHLDKMREQFDCDSVLQLVVFALREGIVR